MSFFEPMRRFYGRFERPISSLSLIGGFVFDALTLERVDTLWENAWIVAHLLIIAVFIFLIHIQENEPGDEANPAKRHFWYVNILQFFFGGILSAFIVFYFRSTDILATWPFILFLAIAFIANESLKRHFIRFSFQVSLFFLCVYSFTIYFFPVLFHSISARIFLLSGAASVIFILIFISLLFYSVKEKFTESKTVIFLLIAGIVVIINALYFTNLIPPIPLSIKEAGVYHSLEKDADGNYDVTYEDHGPGGYLTLYPVFTELPGAPIYAYSAIFSPRSLNLTIVHEWQQYDSTARVWITRSTIDLSVIGGRDGGFRTYSMRSDLDPGRWRVNIMTTDGKLIGREQFTVVSSDTEPVLIEAQK